AVDRVGVMPADLFAVSAVWRGGVTHRGEKSSLWIEEQPRIEELGNLRGRQLLPSTRERLQIDLARVEDHFDLEENGALLEIHLRVQVGRVRITLGALHRLGGTRETGDLHLKMKALQAEHALTRLREQGRAVWRVRPARRQRHHEHETGRYHTGPPSRAHQLLRIRSSPTRRVIFCASIHSSKGRT